MQDVLVTLGGMNMVGKFLRDVGVAVLAGIGVRIGIQAIEKVAEKIEESSKKNAKN